MDSKQNSSVTIFRTFDDGYIVRSMTRADVEILNNWWLPMTAFRLKDLEIVHSLYPPGSQWFYVGEFQGEVVAAVACVPWSEHVYCLAYYFVDAKYRKRGFGMRIKDEVATKHVGDNILALDAISDQMAAVYRDNNGYKNASFSTLKMKAIAKSFYAGVDITRNGTILKIDQVPFQRVLDYDKKYFVGQDFPIRQQFLRQWTQIQGGATYVAMDDDGHVLGYGCRRPTEKEGIHYIGPICAEDSATAEAILMTLCKEVDGGTVFLYYFSCNHDAENVMKKLDFTVIANYPRLHLNGDPNEYKKQIYAITSALCAF